MVPILRRVEDDQIRAQVERVLNSPLFRSSHRCQILLKHVAERVLAGDTGNLKERTLGVDVFGRAPDYDTNADPVVRAAAGEIRKKLAQYYQDPEHAGEVRIELNRGGYVPEFHPVPQAATPTPVSRPKARIVVIAASALAVTLAAAGVLLAAQWRKPALDRFWAPMLDAPGGVLFSLAQPKVYNFRSDKEQKQIETMIAAMSPGEVASSQQAIRLGQLVPMWDRYLAVGDVNCLLRLASVFEKHGKAYRVRSEAATSFSDLRERPSILIGAFDNEWTLRAVGEMRFTFYKDFEGLEIIHDRDHPENTEWKLVNSWPQWNIANDYAIVSRVFDVHTDRMVVIAAGITHFGTAGAGDFLSNPQYFAEAIPRLPRDWQRKNLQIVLRIPVVQGVAGHPQVLATQVW
jgi:hypothetical protein